MKVMIVGSGGQLGHDCSRVFLDGNDLIGFTRSELDVTDDGAVADAMERALPDVVINCAAFTRVDDCEVHSDVAFAVNAGGPENLARSCRRHDALLVHVSTDYVFSGNRPLPSGWTETDETGPLSVYGRSKLEGENRVAGIAPRHIILRTAWLYGGQGHNFLKTMLKLAGADPERTIRVVDDQYGSPTWSLRLALQMRTLVEQGGRGIYHATAEGYCSWFELAAFFLKEMDIPHRIEPCTSDEYPTQARRPVNSILENQRLKAENRHRMTGWRHGVTQFVSRYRSEWLAQLEGQPPVS